MSAKELIKDNQYIYLNDSIVIEVTGKQSKDYSNIDSLIFKGVNIGTIAYNPKALLNVSKYYIQIKIGNEHLYSGLWLDFFKVFYDFNQSIKIARVDIANDSLLTQSKDPLKMLRRYVYNTTEGNTYYIKKKGKSIVNQSYNTFYVGNRNSRKYFKIYNKTEELKHSNKEYIVNYFKNNNLVGNVVRQELTLTGTYASNLDVLQLTDPKYLASIFKAHSKNYYEFYKILNNKKTMTINTVNYNNTKSIYNKPVRVNNKEYLMYNRVKRSLKSDTYKLLFAYCEGKFNDVQTIRKNIVYSINEYNLKDFYKTHIELYKDDFISHYLNTISLNDATFYLVDVNYKTIINNTIIFPTTYEDYIQKIYKSKKMLTVIKDNNRILVVS